MPLEVCEWAKKFGFFSSGEEPTGIAPIRSRPKRIYESFRLNPNTEGEHVPVLLAQLKLSNEPKWIKLQEQLSQFGKGCGLFERIDIERLGKPSPGPFGLSVRLVGANRGKVNLVDVGYGVSQVLPVLTELLLDAGNDVPKVHLLQQPEVHLHPRAQAELGSLFLSLAGACGKRLMVETHSDYLVDRVRSDVRDNSRDASGGLAPDDCQILFSERLGSETRVNVIGIERDGSLRDVPSAFRSFFLKEADRFLGCAEDY